MATAAQLEANQRNALRSTGPTSPEGKAASRENARKHGLAATSTSSETIHPLYKKRLAEWRASIGPETPEARFALQQAVAATFRLEACEAAFAAAVAGQKRRARLVWDDERIADDAALFARLNRMPEVIARRLRTSAQGVKLMLRAWKRLALSLVAKNGAWNEAEVATAGDLLGIPRHLRDGRLPFDPPDPSADLREYRTGFVERQCQMLEDALRHDLNPIDRADRKAAAEGTTAVASPAVRLVLRYEAATRRWYERMLAEARSPSQTEDEAMAEVLSRFALAPPSEGIVDDGDLDDLDAGPIEPPAFVNVGPIDDRPPHRPRPSNRGATLNEMGSAPVEDEAATRAEVEGLMGRLFHMLGGPEAIPDQADRLAEPGPAFAPASARGPNRRARRARAAMARAGT